VKEDPKCAALTEALQLEWLQTVRRVSEEREARLLAHAVSRAYRRLDPSPLQLPQEMEQEVCTLLDCACVAGGEGASDSLERLAALGEVGPVADLLARLEAAPNLGGMIDSTRKVPAHKCLDAMVLSSDAFCGSFMAVNDDILRPFCVWALEDGDSDHKRSAISVLQGMLRRRDQGARRVFAQRLADLAGAGESEPSSAAKVEIQLREALGNPLDSALAAFDWDLLRTIATHGTVSYTPSYKNILPGWVASLNELGIQSAADGQPPTLADALRLLRLIVRRIRVLSDSPNLIKSLLDEHPTDRQQVLSYRCPKAESEKGSGAMYRHLRHTTLDGAATKLPNEGQVCSAHAARDGPSPILASSSNIL
jgi:hypothetical protein